MLETEVLPRESDETVVRHYFAALQDGRVVDVLNAFTMDATLRNEDGRERKGIREIAAAFTSHRSRTRIEIQGLRRRGDAVVAVIRIRDETSGKTRIYRDTFRLIGGRVRSLRVNPVPS